MTEYNLDNRHRAEFQPNGVKPSPAEAIHRTPNSPERSSWPDLTDFGSAQGDERIQLLSEVMKNSPDNMPPFHVAGYDWLVVDRNGDRERNENSRVSSTIREAAGKCLKFEMTDADRTEAAVTLRREFIEHADQLRSEFKIHLQPKHRDVGPLLRRLAEALCDSQDDRLRQVVPVIKLRRRDTTDNPDDRHLPEIVAYVRPALKDGRADPEASRTNCVTALRRIEELTRDLNDLAQPLDRAPRFNQSVSELVHVAQSGGDLKEALERLGLLDEFFDADNNHATLHGETPISLDEPTPTTPKKQPPVVPEGPRHVRF